MKKNISINISGIIFHIEEDGYERFKKYLDSINRYFASYEDSEEIVADIESRIAELFLEKLDDGKQVISIEDVDVLINTMGQISDFEAMEEEADFSKQEPVSDNAQTEEKEKSKKEKKRKTTNQNSTTPPPRRLQRDSQNQVLGGVAAGLAHYFKTDPIWTRGAFIVFTLTGLSPLVYIIMWIAIPANDALVEQTTVKKLYRNPDERVLGGVASGLANYFKVDSIGVRIAFILLTFAGIGILTYIVLWIICPKANSITDKMQMKGEKVTLSNIDSSIKQNKEEELNPKGENAFTTILLFPFRLIGKVFSLTGKVLAPLFQFIGAAIRVFTGGVIAITGISVMFSLLVTAGVVLGLYNGDWFIYGNEAEYFPYEVFTNTFPELGLLFVLIAIFIPFLYVFIAGITIIAKRKIMSGSVGWSILGIWMIAVIGTFAILPNIIRDFSEEGYYEEVEAVNIQADTLFIGINDFPAYEYDSRRSRRRFRTDDPNEWTTEFTDIDLEASKDDAYSLKKRFRARGRDPKDADFNAQDVTYGYKVEEDKILFDPQMRFKPRAEFRFQELDATFYIPKNVPFKISRELRDIVNRFSYRYTWRETYLNTWMFNDSGQLVCLTCDKDDYQSSSRYDNGDYSKTIAVDAFTGLDVWENMEVIITNSDSYELVLEGPRSKVEKVFVQVAGEELKIDEDGSGGDWSNVKVYIKCPPLKSIDLQNGATIKYAPKESGLLVLKMYDKSKADISGNLDELELYITDNSRIDLTATVKNMKASIIEKGRLYAYDSNVEEAEVSTSSEGRARLNVKGYLIAEAGGLSSIRYKGNPQLEIRDESRTATISKY
ncbi:PspC domain-containing protein [Roseivirga sp.]|uniref:PspC domain-containing protein n=1 Tax=Roseivirga sp. TaxID=1964215 RepID=UPI003B8BDD07